MTDQSGYGMLRSSLGGSAPSARDLSGAQSHSAAARPERLRGALYVSTLVKNAHLCLVLYMCFSRIATHTNYYHGQPLWGIPL